MDWDAPVVVVSPGSDGAGSEEGEGEGREGPGGHGVAAPLYHLTQEVGPGNQLEHSAWTAAQNGVRGRVTAPEAAVARSRPTARDPVGQLSRLAQVPQDVVAVNVDGHSKQEEEETCSTGRRGTPLTGSAPSRSVLTASADILGPSRWAESEPVQQQPVCAAVLLLCLFPHSWSSAGSCSGFLPGPARRVLLQLWSCWAVLLGWTSRNQGLPAFFIASVFPVSMETAAKDCGS